MKSSVKQTTKTKITFTSHKPCLPKIYFRCLNDNSGRKSLGSMQKANKTPAIKVFPASKLGNMIYGVQFGIWDLMRMCYTISPTKLRCS